MREERIYETVTHLSHADLHTVRIALLKSRYSFRLAAIDSTIDRSMSRMAVARKPIRRRLSKSDATGVTELKTLVDALIKENRSLKLRLARLEAKETGSGDNSHARGLKTIANRLKRALAASTSRNRRRSSTSTSVRGRSGGATVARVRKPVSPETQQKRLAALERARAARAAKKAQAS